MYTTSFSQMNHRILLPQLSILHKDIYICGSSLVCASCLKVHSACCTSTYLWILENPGQRGTSLHMPLYDAKPSHDNLTCARNVSCNLWVMSPQGTEVGARWTVYGTQQVSLLRLHQLLMLSAATQDWPEPDAVHTSLRAANLMLAWAFPSSEVTLNVWHAKVTIDINSYVCPLILINAAANTLCAGTQI